MANSSGMKNACYATGGAVIGTRSQFMKTPDQFRGEAGTGDDQTYGKRGKGKASGNPDPKVTLPKGKAAKLPR